MAYVDIPNLFRDFDADENDPANYDFAFTDRLMLALERAGVEPFFRLGVTIEGHSKVKAYRIFPPKDYAKWARICEHVIRHYTEGWADGFKMKVEHWEIWNEPENQPSPDDNPMWRGDWESYMRFYGVVAPYLKSKFPHLKIGGYGSCGFYAAVGSAAQRHRAGNDSPSRWGQAARACGNLRRQAGRRRAKPLTAMRRRRVWIPFAHLRRPV